MAQRKYELAAAYVRIMPSLEGVAAAVGKELSKGLRQGAAEAPIEKSVREKVESAVSGISLGDIGGRLFSSANKIVAPLTGALVTTVRAAGNLLGDTLITGAGAAGTAFAAAFGAVGTQIVGGGLNRALGLNNAEAGLRAMGYEGQQFTNIMTAAGKAVDGTAYSMDQSVLAARNFLASGVPEDKLQGYLENVGKLSDIGTRSYSDIAAIMQKISASGRAQGDDFLQLADAGIPIFNALAESLGVSVAEVRKLGSEGKVSFEQLNDAVSNIDFDSALFASIDVASAFRNVRSQLSKTGEKLWDPIVEALPSILGDVRTFISTFNSSFDFNPIQTRLAAGMERIAAIFDRFKGIDGNLNIESIKSYFTEAEGSIGTFAKKFAGYETIIAGTAVGLSGGILSQIPVIGPAFSRLTPVVGAFAGVLVSAYQNSEQLQTTVKGLPNVWKTVRSKLFSKVSFNGNDIFRSLGDGISDSILWIQDLITETVVSLSDKIPLITKTVEDVFKYLGAAFKDAGERGLNGEAIANLFMEIVKIFGTFAPLAFQVLLEASIIVADITSSGWFKTLVDWLAGSMLYLSQNEMLISTGLKVAAAIFVGGKIVAIVKGMIGFVNSMKTLAPAVDVASKSGDKATGSFKALFKSMGKIALIIGAIVLLMAGAGWLDQKFELSSLMDTYLDSVFRQADKIATGLSQTFDTLVPSVEGILESLNTVFADLVQKLFLAVVEPGRLIVTTLAGLALDIAEASSQVFSGLSGLADSGTDFLSQIGKLLSFLAVDGVAAGEGAMSASLGIAALMAAVAGGTLAAAGGSLLSNILPGKKDGADPLADILALIKGVVQLSTLSQSLPTVFSAALLQSTTFGVQLTTSIAAGINSGSAAISASLALSLRNAMQQQQGYLDANPLVVRVKVDEIKVGATSGTRTAGGSGSQTTTNNYKVTANAASITKLLNDGRGY